MVPYIIVNRNDPVRFRFHNAVQNIFVHESVEIGEGCKFGRNVVIEEGCKIGPGCFFGHNCIVRPRTTLGSKVEIRAGAWVANDCVIEDETSVFNNAIVGAFTIIRKYVYFGPGVISTNVRDIVKYRDRETDILPVIIESGARIASNATLNAGVNLGANCLIGAGSVVTRDVPARQVWWGNPARFQRNVSEDDMPSAWTEIQ